MPKFDDVKKILELMRESRIKEKEKRDRTPMSREERIKAEIEDARETLRRYHGGVDGSEAVITSCHTSAENESFSFRLEPLGQARIGQRKQRKDGSCTIVEAIVRPSDV